ncbi:MAG: PEP-CTERM sorting domain-containing protein [Pirellulales bacterium]|nr:PEP-CTERM sorting domain-containing protein [Pirellulales bacterium]
MNPDAQFVHELTSCQHWLRAFIRSLVPTTSTTCCSLLVGQVLRLIAPVSMTDDGRLAGITAEIVVPEPSSVLIVVVGVVCCAAMRRNKSRTRKQ